MSKKRGSKTLASLSRLRDLWYQKLKEQGFKDIEEEGQRGEPRLKAWDSHYFQARHEPQVFAIKHEYYYQAGQFLLTHTFESETHRHVWELHAEGLGFRAIAHRLKLLGLKTNKDDINKIVRALKEVMKAHLKQEEETWKNET